MTDHQLYCCDEHYDSHKKYIGCAKGTECKGQQWYHYSCTVQRFGAPANLTKLKKKQVAKLHFVCTTSQAPAVVEEKDVVEESETEARLRTPLKSGYSRNRNMMASSSRSSRRRRSEGDSSISTCPPFPRHSLS